MLENFSDRGRQVIVLAEDQARDLRHNYIGTEHLLLGILLEEQGDAARALKAFRVTTDRARREVTQMVGAGPDPVAGHVPFNPRTRNILQRANRIRLSLGADGVEPEHLLLALLRDEGGVAIRILTRFNVEPETVRSQLVATSPAN